jgi:hypothetical protein
VDVYGEKKVSQPRLLFLLPWQLKTCNKIGNNATFVFDVGIEIICLTV